jgi:hypothetical protein
MFWGSYKSEGVVEMLQKTAEMKLYPSIDYIIYTTSALLHKFAHNVNIAVINHRLILGFGSPQGSKLLFGQVPNKTKLCESSDCLVYIN